MVVPARPTRDATPAVYGPLRVCFVVRDVGAETVLRTRSRAGGQESGGSGPGNVRGGFARAPRARGGLLDEASGHLLAIACSFMFPPALIVRDWPVFRIVGQSLDFQVLLFGISGTCNVCVVSTVMQT
ncbi:hypothetical protein CFB39_33535 [Burkholderia sp. AU6039]|nr:hypothetical protein CFB39_33535 [Burkholderia sp. AU6039]